MTNLERIEAQKNDFDKLGNPLTPITQELLDNGFSRNFASGREKKIGDWNIFGFLTSDEDENMCSLITLHEDEYGTLYEDHPRVNDPDGSKMILELKKKINID